MVNKERNSDRDADIFSADYDFAQYKIDLLSGKMKMLRLLCILTVLNAGYLVSALFDTDQPEMYYPFHLKGSSVYVLFSLTFILFLFLTTVNWINWTRNRK